MKAFLHLCTWVLLTQISYPLPLKQPVIDHLRNILAQNPSEDKRLVYVYIDRKPNTDKYRKNEEGATMKDKHGKDVVLSWAHSSVYVTGTATDGPIHEMGVFGAKGHRAGFGDALEHALPSTNTGGSTSGPRQRYLVGTIRFPQQPGAVRPRHKDGADSPCLLPKSGIPDRRGLCGQDQGL